MKDEMMPFGSMCNSYGLANKGSCPPIDKFLEDMDEIMERAIKYCRPTKNEPTRSEIKIPE